MVKDLITKNANAIFILESPHAEEISSNEKIPLLGRSGAVFSRVLLSNAEVAGLQIEKGHILYSVINTFQEALQLSPQMKPLHSMIENISFSNTTQYKKDLKNLFPSHEINYPTLEDYKIRICTAINAMQQDSLKLVVCGFIAQSYFEDAFKVSNTKFTNSFNAQICDKPIKVFYIWHPSPSSGENGTSAWELQKNNTAIKRLKQFVEA